MKKNIIMLLMAVAVFAGFQAKAQIKSITAAEVKDLMLKGYQFIDVREVDEVKELAYDLENVKNIPLSELEARIGEFSKDKKYIIACKSGARSTKACNILVTKGFENMVNLEGGIMKWQESGNPVKDAAAQKAEQEKNPTETTKPCCANPNSKKCNPDGTCKTKKNGKPYKEYKKQ